MITSPFARTVVATIVGATALTGLGLAGASPASAAASRELVIDFGNVNGTVTDGTRIATGGTARTTAVLRTHAGGRGSEVSGRRGGKALRLPAFDANARISTVPLAVISVTGAGLDPGWKPFAFGASFKLSSSGYSALDNGENLVQRGRYAAGSQYKLQVDRGRVTCRVRGSSGAVMVTGPRVARDAWYDARCSRSASGVRLQLTRYDGGGSRWTRAWTGSGRTGTLSGLATSTPLSVGGKLNLLGRPMVADSDQFNGVVDNIFVDIQS